MQTKRVAIQQLWRTTRYQLHKEDYHCHYLQQVEGVSQKNRWAFLYVCTERLLVGHGYDLHGKRPMADRYNAH